MIKKKADCSVNMETFQSTIKGKIIYFQGLSGYTVWHVPEHITASFIYSNMQVRMADTFHASLELMLALFRELIGAQYMTFLYKQL